MQHGYDMYKANDIETASGIKLVVMLYNGAIKFLTIAIEAIEQKQLDIANNNIIKAQNIVGELLSSLDFSAGDIAQELSRLYIYVHKLLIEANIQKQVLPLSESIEILSNLKDGWTHLLNLEEKPNNPNINISG
ncbi:MAG: flagellar export chaperone FliS [Brevinemataceae bacterium]